MEYRETVTLKDGRTVRAAGTNAGGYDMELSLDDFDIEAAPGYQLASDPDLKDGWLYVEPFSIKVEVIGNTKTVPFNGSEQRVEGFTVNVLTADYPDTFNSSRVLWKDGETGETPAATGTKVSEDPYMMGLKEEDFSYTEKDGLENFMVEIGVTDGWLKIIPFIEDEKDEPEATEVKVRITGNTGTAVYDGTEKVVSGFDLSTEDELYDVMGKTYYGGLYDIARRTEVGTTYMGLAASQFANGDLNFAVTYEVENGWVEITSTKEMDELVDAFDAPVVE